MRGKRNCSLGYLAALLVFLCVVPVRAAENTVFYSSGKKDPAAWTVLRDFLFAKGRPVSFYQGDAGVDRHMEKINRINASKASAFVAVQFTFGEKNVIVAMAETVDNGTVNNNAIETRQTVLRADEVQSRHAVQSRKLAETVATQFHVTVRKMPLFPLLGVDMPGVFVSIRCTREEAESMLALLDGALQKYYKKEK